MTDDYNNNNVEPEEPAVDDTVDSSVENAKPETNDQTHDAGSDGTTVSEPEKEEPHTSIPGGFQSQNVYNNYNNNNLSDGQYRIVYNRPQNNGGQNQTGNQYYARQNAYGNQNYGTGYTGSGNYGYKNMQQPNQTYYRPQPQPQVKQPQSKKNGGKIAAIIAVAAALAIIFAVVGLVIGVMLGRSANNYTIPKDAETSDKSNYVTDKTPEDVQSSTSEHLPLTDPSAEINKNSTGEVLSMAEAASKVVDSVVEIRTEKVVKGSFMQQYTAKGAGSGVVITEDGYIATNNHVIEGATTIDVILRDGTVYSGRLVGTEAMSDIAVVKVEATGLKPASFGDSDKLVVAQNVLAIGNPLGELGGSVTEGIISALARNVKIENQEMTLLQTTAAINPGNSGGGLFNLAGECIGIVNAKSSGTDVEGIGFAIPSNTAIKVIEDLMHYGYVRGRVMLGINMVEINDQYSLYRYNLQDPGVYVSKVISGSDAEKGGIKYADRLVSINGTNIETSYQAKKIIQSCSVGDTVEIVVSRNGENVTLRITLTEYVAQGSLEIS